jgi:hypothetical protein
VRPRSALRVAAVAAGPRRREHHPRRELALRLGWVARAAARLARPRCPEATLRVPADPSWGQLPAGRPRLAPPGSGRGRPRAVPRSSLSLRDGTPRQSAAETMGEPEVRACRACGAGA